MLPVLDKTMLGQPGLFHLGVERSFSKQMHRILYVSEVVLVNERRNRRLSSLCGSTFQEVQAATLAADQKRWKTHIARDKDAVHGKDKDKVRI